jgi:hypothetical protein
MPLYEKPPQKHPHQCWRWSDHWRCAADLVEQLAEAADDMLAALKAEYGTDDTTAYPGSLMDAADALIAALAAAGYRMQE